MGLQVAFDYVLARSQGNQTSHQLQVPSQDGRCSIGLRLVHWSHKHIPLITNFEVGSGNPQANPSRSELAYQVVVREQMVRPFHTIAAMALVHSACPPI